MSDARTILRRFNRTFTSRVGALEESFLGTGRPLGVSRLLFEIGDADGAVGLVDLRLRLGVDSGYLARLLRRLEADGLVTTYADPDDQRRRLVALTGDGVRAYADLERRSEERAAAILAPLTTRQAARLGEALATADLLVRAATVAIGEVGAAEPGAVEAVRRYVAELDRRFDGGFGVPAAPEPEDDGATYLLATDEGRPVGYGGVRSLGDATTGEVKRMWVDPTWRGAGLGGRMLRELEALAVRRGHRRLVLDTHGSLEEAVALYERAGWVETGRYNDNPYAERFFEKSLTDVVSRPSRST